MTSRISIVDPDYIAGTIPTPGDYVAKFNRYYLAINPNPAQGPPTWRVSDPDEFPCGGDIIVLPPDLEFMVVAQSPIEVSGDTTGIEYTFNLDGIPLIDTVGDQKITYVENLERPILITNRTDDPVKSSYDNNDKATITTFDITGLSYEDYIRKEGRTMKVTVYNSSRSIPITSSDPVQTASNAAATDLFFDISSLPHTT